MGLVNLEAVLRDANEKEYAVPSFNVTTFEGLKGLMAAAQEERAPLILAVTPKFLNYFGPDYLCPMVLSTAGKSDLPVVFHMDHGKSVKDVQTAMVHGFTSVMIDGSLLPFEENAELTARVTEFAHSVGISVEGELGTILLAADEQENSGMTDPDLAATFVKETGVDALAVSVGNAHGLYTAEPNIDVKRLEEIHAGTGASLVLHGGSGTPKITEMIQAGLRKININADFQKAFYQTVRQAIEEHPGELLYTDALLGGGVEAVKKAAVEKIRLLKANGRY